MKIYVKEEVMRKTRILLPILTVGMLGFLVVGPGLAFQNEPDGFRGLKWGDPPGEDMVNRRSINPDFVWYRRAGDKMEIGRAELISLHYAFYKGQFFLAEIIVKASPVEITHYDYLKDVLILKFGRGNQVGEQIIRWGGLINGETTVIVLENWGGLSGKLTIYSRKIYLQKQDDERDEVREGAEQGLDDF